VARVLIVGCGCRGRELAAALVAEGHAVRGTTRRAGSVAEIEAVGAEAAVADPDRLATILPQLEGVSAVCWLMGSAVEEPETLAALHGPRLETLLERLVDTPVRGVVYEAAGSVPADLLARGAGLVREASDRWRIRVEILDEAPADHDAWLAATTQAVERLLAA
jgi:nucleoside-diphosphate-sugar epimerase